MRVLLFTDTYADVNGPSRFIGNIADQAVETGRDLRVFTSTRLPHKTRRNVTNFEPLFAMKMPRYDTLDLAIPPLTRMLREVDRVRPDVIHISTPGPVGVVGLIASRMMRCPVVGVYHTDFPAYIDRLFDDHVLTQTCSHAMRMFYRTFRAIFTRSEDYAASLERMGIERGRLTRLLPGIDLTDFNPGYRDPSIWDRLPAAAGPGGSHREARRGDPVRVLYCGRVSVEKNLPMLTRVWKGVQERLGATGSRAELVIVGDGPYRPEMEKELSGWNTRFVGFRHGHELSTIYASSDMFVFPSVTDTLGQVVMESQASGLPVLVTDQGGPKEVVTHRQTGLVLGAGEIGPWIDAICGLVADGERRRSMGSAAVEIMARRSIAASFDHFWSVHEKVYAAT
ncbi:MAG: GDP-mannose-dependent alpha-mannosyltransferase [Phycisphaerales bacterium]|nr:GDP-mannose-dependent alpha-mannosyltransferase [Phycisphaerales bacterium]